ncbi:cytochrome P450 [Aspergillus fruticulosus]
MMQQPASSRPLLFNQTLLGQGSLVQSANTSVDVLSSCACVLLLVAAIVFYSKTGRKRPGHTIPLITSLPSDKTNGSSEHLSVNLLGLLRHGYEKFKHEVFLLRPPHGDQLVIPAKYLDELKSLPESKISLAESLSGQFLGDFTYIGKHDSTMLTSIREDLARNMETTITHLEAETRYAFETLFDDSERWQSAKVQPTMLRVVALLSGRVFVGSGLSRNKEFLDCIVQFTIDSFVTAEKLHRYPASLRPLIRRWIPEYNAVQKELADMTRLLRPLVEARIHGQTGNAGENNMVDWNMKNSPAPLRANVAYQAMQQLQVSFAAIHTTTKLLTNIIFELASRPEYIQPLRTEIESCWSSVNGTAGWSKSALSRLHKLDSFMTETQRHNPPGIMTFNRRMTSDMTLSNGTYLPRGTYLAAASSQIAMDGEFWDNPERFDGFRFDRMRQEVGAERKYQFVSTGPRMLLFGYGTHACPGRFFVSNEVKIIVSYLIMNFDMALPDGQGRPRPITYDVAFKPDPNQEVLFRKRAR